MDEPPWHKAAQGPPVLTHRQTIDASINPRVKQDIAVYHSTFNSNQVYDPNNDCPRPQPGP